MSVLQSQYWTCFKFYQDYIKNFLQRDIQRWMIGKGCWLNLNSADLEDIKSELKYLLLADIRKKYQGNICLIHSQNYVLTVCKYDLKNILIKMLRLKKNKSRYENKWKAKMIDAKHRKNENLLVTLDSYSYEEIRELFKSVLNIREMAVVYLVHCCVGYAKIAKKLKISSDYCRKIYNTAENKLTKAVFE